MNKESFYRVSVKGLALDKSGKFLLAKQSDGIWELPGGGLHHGEDPIDGLRREIKEECGLEMSYISPTPNYFITASRVEGDGFVANVIYEVKFKNIDFTPSEECTELRYVSVSEAKKLNMFGDLRAFIKVFRPELHK